MLLLFLKDFPDPHHYVCVFSGAFVDLLGPCDLMPFKWRIWFKSNLIQQIQLIKRHPIKQYDPIFVEVLFLQSPFGSSPYVSVHQHFLIILFYGHPGCLSFLSTPTWFWHLRMQVLWVLNGETPQTDFRPPFQEVKNLCGDGVTLLWCIFFKQHVFFAIFLGTMISFGTFHHHLGTSPGGRVAGAERKRFVSRKTRGFGWEIFGAAGAWKCRGCCVLRENKKGPNDQSSKGVGCWLLVFWGRGFGKKLNQKIFLPNGVREKEKKRKHSFKSKDI